MFWPRGPISLAEFLCKSNTVCFSQGKFHLLLSPGICLMKMTITHFTRRNRNLQSSDCPKYLPVIVANILSMTTSSSNSNFPARKLAHFLSKHRRAAHVSASKRVSIAAQRANSHAQSFLDKVVIFSANLIRLLSDDNRATESIPKTADKVGLSLELPHTEVLELSFSREGEASFSFTDGTGRG